jgi:hypothetical protein
MDPVNTRPGAAPACAAVALVLALASASCRQSRDEIADEGASPDTMGKHWVQDERLRGVMAELSRQAAHWPAGVPDDPESPASDPETETTFRDAAQLADGLARAARDIPRAVADREMTPDDRRGFNAEARRLREQAVQLGQAARGRKVERMQRLLDGISSSCISCHSQYRDFAGELNTSRAAAE